MSNKIKVQPSNSFRVRTGDQTGIQIVSSALGSNVTGVSGVEFDLSGIQDNYVLQYDAATNKIKPVNPDTVLTDASSDGLPGAFINALDTDINRVDNIDFDGGNF